MIYQRPDRSAAAATPFTTLLAVGLASFLGIAGIAAISNLSQAAAATNVVTAYRDGATFGDWRVVFAGYGAVSAYSQQPTRLTLRPQAVSSPSATSSALAVSRTSFTTASLDVQTAVTTTKQLRTGSTPNPWEVAWLVWDYTDNEHFYYAVAKPNGWELGKRDPAYPGGQRFLATGSTPAIGIGTKATIRIVRTGTGSASSIKLLLNGSTLATFNDTERPYRSGNVGAYTEDAAVDFSYVRVNGKDLRSR